MRLGDMSADEALGIVAQSQKRSADTTALVDQPQANGFPGFESIWQYVTGITGGIVTKQPNLATTVPLAQTQTAGMPLAVAGVAAVAALLFLAETRRGKKSRYRRMKARRK